LIAENQKTIQRIGKQPQRQKQNRHPDAGIGFRILEQQKRGCLNNFELIKESIPERSRSVSSTMLMQ
jgi:hypothetical protein